MGMVIEDGETSEVIVRPIGVEFCVIEFVPMNKFFVERWKASKGISGRTCGEI